MSGAVLRQFDCCVIAKRNKRILWYKIFTAKIMRRAPLNKKILLCFLLSTKVFFVLTIFKVSSGLNR